MNNEEIGRKFDVLYATTFPHSKPFDDSQKWCAQLLVRAAWIQAYEEAAQAIDRYNSQLDYYDPPAAQTVVTDLAERVRALKDPLCQHDWIDARNEVVESGEYCSKCGALRPVESVSS